MKLSFECNTILLLNFQLFNFEASVPFAKFRALIASTVLLSIKIHQSPKTFYLITEFFVKYNYGT